MKKILLMVALCFSLSQAAEYKVVVKGHSAGKAKLSMVTTGNSYQVSLTLFPNVMAKMFGIDDMRDSSTGSVVNGHYTPKSYRRVTLDGKQLFSVDFTQGRAKKNNEGKISTVEVSPQGQDPLAQMAQIQHDLKKGSLAKQYHLITEKTQRLFTASSESLKSGQLVVLKQSPSGDRTLRLWFDKSYNLTRMQKEKRGKIDFDMTKK